jgi:hypothetical protein
MALSTPTLLEPIAAKAYKDCMTSLGTAWADGADGVITEDAPSNGSPYSRQDGTWVAAATYSDWDSTPANLVIFGDGLGIASNVAG